MKKKILLIALIIIIGATNNLFAQRGRQAGNRNLRENNATTLLGVNAVYKQNGENSGVGAGLSVTNLYNWFQFGTSVDYVSSGCFSGKFQIGPAIWFGNLYGGISLDMGLAQCLRLEEYVNENTLDVFRTRTPAPKMTLGGSLRLGFVMERFGIQARVSYDNANGYTRGAMLGEPWVLRSSIENENVITAELGISLVLGSNEIRYSGDNCYEFSGFGGMSSYGAFLGSELIKFERTGYAVGRSYGCFASFYLGNGNAELGGKYMFNWYPGGSNSIYTGSIGAELAMGQYKRQWNGSADDPERFSVKARNYAFGGRFAGIVEPVALQLGQFKISAFGSIGYAVWIPVKATGNLGYEATSENSGLYWNFGGRLSIAL